SLELDDAVIYYCICRSEKKIFEKVTNEELPYEFIRPLDETITIIEKQWKFQAILSIIPSSDTNCIEGTYEFHIRSHIRNGNHISKTDNEKVNFNNSKIFYMILKRQNID
ncbi:unnamed protein product, partial [Rotaria sp. Silwood1]